MPGTVIAPFYRHVRNLPQHPRRLRPEIRPGTPVTAGHGHPHKIGTDMTAPAVIHAEDQRRLTTALQHLVEANYRHVAGLTDAGILPAETATALIARCDQLLARISSRQTG